MATLTRFLIFVCIFSLSNRCSCQFIRGMLNQQLLVNGQDFNQGPPGAFNYGPPFQTSKLYRVHGMPMAVG